MAAPTRFPSRSRVITGLVFFSMIMDLAHAEPPIANSGFEAETLDPWNVSLKEHAGRDDEIKQEGTASLRLVSGGERRPVVAAQLFDALPAGKKMVFRAVVRTRDAGKAWLEVVFRDVEGKRIGGAQSQPVSGTTFEEDWQPLEAEATVPEGTVKAGLQLHLAEGGSAWFDAVFVGAAAPRAGASARAGKKLEFHRVFHRERTTLTPDMVAQARHGLLIFRRPFMEHLFSNSIPKKEELSGSFEVRAAPGEREPLLIGLHAIEEVGEITVQAGTFEGPDGKPLPSTAIELRTIREIPKRPLYAARWSTAYLMMPMVLEPARAFPLKAGMSQGVLIDFHVPDKTPPGFYRGSVLLKTRAARIALPITLHVYPFELTAAKEMIYGVYEADSLNRADEVEAMMRDMRENGMTMISCGAGGMRIKGDLRVEFTDAFEAVLELYSKLGFSAPIILGRDHAFLYAEHRVGWGNDGYDEAYAAASRARHEALKARGISDYYIKSVDEAGFKSDLDREKSLHILKLGKRLGLFKSMINEPPGDYLVNQAGKYANLWICNGEAPSAEIVMQAKNAGRKVLIYNTDVETWRPLVTRYSAGFFQWKFGLDGVLQWEYQNRTGDYGVKAYHEIGSEDQLAYMAYVYPPHRQYPGGPTLSWIGFREGVDDYRYLLTLREQLQRSGKSNPAKAQEVEARLNELIASLKPTRRLRNVGGWSEEGSDARGPYVSGTYNLDNGWSPADYDLHRRRIAEWIMELLAEQP